MNLPRYLASVISPSLGSLSGKRASTGAMIAVREATITKPSHQAPSQPSSPSLRPASRPGATYSWRQRLPIDDKLRALRGWTRVGLPADYGPEARA